MCSLPSSLTHTHQFCNDTVVWDLEALRWRQPLEAAIPGGGRNFHSATWALDRLWITCGKANGYRNDVLVWRDDARGWSNVTPTARGPDARWGQASVLVGTRWLIHGGYDSDAMFAKDLWVLDLERVAWTRVEQRGAVPEGRQHHTMAALGATVYMWGGKTNAGPCAPTMHVLNAATGEWAELKASKKTKKKLRPRVAASSPAQHPAPRWGHTLTPVPTLNEPLLLLFGGRDAERTYNDAWVFHTDTATWEQWDAAFAPEPRAFHTATLFGERLHIFGGRHLEDGGDSLNSLFKIDISKACPFRMLPADVLAYLMQWLDPRDVTRLCCVSRDLNRIASSDRVWKRIYDNRMRWIMTGAWISSPPSRADVQSFKELTRVEFVASCASQNLGVRVQGVMRGVKIVVVGDGGACSPPSPFVC